MSSTVPAVLAKLLDLAETDAQLGNNGNGITVWEGDPEDHEVPEYLSIGEVVLDESWAALGARRREERYQISGVLSVRRGEDTTRAGTRARIFDLFARVEAIALSLAASPSSPGVPGVTNIGLVVAAYTPFTDSATKAFSTSLRFGIAVTARI